MDPQLLVQLKSWNPWWQLGLKGAERYRVSFYKREIFSETDLILWFKVKLEGKIKKIIRVWIIVWTFYFCSSIILV